MLAVCIPIVVIGPIIAYPFSKTIWVAVDRAFLQQLDVNEVRDEQAAPHLTRSRSHGRQKARTGQAGGRRSTVSVRTPSTNAHAASPTIAKSWKSSCACSMKR